MDIDDGASMGLPPEQRELPCAVGGELTPETLLKAMRDGWIVIPNEGSTWKRAAEFRFSAKVADGTIAVYPPGTPAAYAYTWWSPRERFVVPASDARLHPKLRSRLRRVSWTSTIDESFADVVEGCRYGREPRWLTDDYIAVLADLRQNGRAYSAEVWEDGVLVAGSFGYIVGDVVTVESNFTRRTGASKLSVVDVARRAAESGFTLVDLQWPTEHGREVGGRLVPVDTLVRALAANAARQLPAGERPSAWLLDDPRPGNVRVGS